MRVELFFRTRTFFLLFFDSSAQRAPFALARSFPEFNNVWLLTLLLLFQVVAVKNIIPVTVSPRSFIDDALLFRA